MKVWLVGEGYWGKKISDTLKEFPDKIDVQVIDTKQGKTLHDISTKDPVILATPLWQHYEQVLHLLHEGHDVFVEKPMAQITAQLKSIELNLKDQVLMVGHIFMYNPLLKTLKELIENGTLGDLKFIESRRLNWGIRQTKTTPTLSLAPHDISILRYLLGDINVTYATTQNYSNNQVYDSITFGGNNFETKCSWWWPTRERIITLIGDKAQAIWNEDLKIIGIKHGYLEDNGYPCKKIKQEIIKCNSPKTPLYLELEHFIDCVKNRKTPITDIKNAFGVGKNIDQITNILSGEKNLDQVKLEKTALK